MWLVILSALALASPLSEEMSAELLAQPSNAARVAYATEQLATTEGDERTRWANAVSVFSVLDAMGRDEPVVVRRFADAAVADEAGVRASAVAMASDPEQTPGGEVQPVVSTTAAAPSAPVPTASTRAVREYRQRHLTRGQLQIVSGSMNAYGGQVSTVQTWAVYDGRGTPVTAPKFAEITSDSAMQADLERRKTAARNASIGLCVGSAAMGGIGTAMMVDSTQRGGDLSLGGILLGSLGLSMLGTCWMPSYFHTQRRQYVARFYSPAEADERINDYNDVLRDELGLDETTAIEIEGED